MGYRQGLPQLEGGLFLTDGGIETTLIFHRGLDLPAFAAFVLLRDDARHRRAAPLLRAVRRAGAEQRRRPRAGEPDLAGEPALGRTSSAIDDGELDDAEPAGDRV